jgi:ComF family protein
MLRFNANRFWWGLLDLVFPPRCESCKRVGERLCANCCEKIEYIEEPICARCGYPKNTPTADECDQCRRISFSNIRIRSLAFHEGVTRTAIHSLKYRHTPVLGETLAELMSRQWRDDLPRDALMIPVPLGLDRRRTRGFNQAEMLARGLGTRWRHPVIVDGLSRIRETRSQVGLTARDRQINVSQAFCASVQVKGRPVIIVDDVCTTGATLSACADALLKSGATEVWAYTLARARHDADILS